MSTRPPAGRIAVDAMGGDHAPGPIVDGALAAARYSGVAVTLVGRLDALAPILESQRPRPLPLDPTAELAQHADRTSSSYRRWLAGLGLTYGTIPMKETT